MYVQIKSEPEDKKRTVFIDDLGIGSLNFDISRKQRAELMNQGKIATEKFLEKWNQKKEGEG